MANIINLDLATPEYLELYKAAYYNKFNDAKIMYLYREVDLYQSRPPSYWGSGLKVITDSLDNERLQYLLSLEIVLGEDRYVFDGIQTDWEIEPYGETPCSYIEVYFSRKK